MPITKLTLAGALLAAAGYVGGAGALTFSEVPRIETIAARASIAFRGVVLGYEYADAQLDATHSYPYTLTRLRALACYRGCVPGEEITLARIGGPRNGDMRHYLMIPGLATFQPGEEVVIFANDLDHPFFGSSYGDHGVLRVAQAGGGERVVLTWAGHFMRDHAGTLRADAASRCERIAGRPQDCFITAGAADESGDDEGAAGDSRADALVTPELLDQRMHEIAREHPIAQAPQSVSGDAQTFERALAALFRSTHTH